jgi:hypothetical protein
VSTCEIDDLVYFILHDNLRDSRRAFGPEFKIISRYFGPFLDDIRLLSWYIH